MLSIIIISVFILFITSLLVLPVRLIINSADKKFYVEMPFFFRIQLVTNVQELFIRIRLFLIPIKLKLQSNKWFNKEPDNQKKVRKQKRRKSNFFNKKIAKKALQAFTVKSARVNIDTGDFPLNAQLIPLTQIVNYNNVQLEINFEAKVDVDVNIFTRLYKFLWIIITNNNYIKSRNYGK